jgi:AcrR family transcriptional regulator
MENKTKETQKKRDEIREAAYGLFLEHGYNGTSMRQIAQKAGLVVGGIYNHFPGKEAVYQAVLTAHHPFQVLFPELAKTRGETAEEYIRDAARLLVAAFGRDRKFLRLMLIELVEFNNRHITALIEEQMPLLQRFVEGLYDRRKSLRALPPVVLMRSFLGFFISYQITEILFVPQLPAVFSGDVFDPFVNIYLHGILEHRPNRTE